MPNYISGITLSDTTYSVQDTEARASLSSAFSAIETLSSSVATNTSNITALSSAVSALTGATKWIGVTTTNISDGSTTNPITINGEEVEAEEGNITSKGSKEFIWNGTAWQEFGDLSSLGSLAFADTASTSYTPEGSVSITISNGTHIPNNVVYGCSSSANIYAFSDSTPIATVSEGVLTFQNTSVFNLSTRNAGFSEAITSIASAISVAGEFTGSSTTITVE